MPLSRRKPLPYIVWAVAQLMATLSLADYNTVTNPNKPCLPNPAPPTGVTDRNGIARTLRVKIGNWDAPHILGRMAQIIMTEGVGVTVDFAVGAGSNVQTRNITGCLDYECTTVEDFPYGHFDFENWLTKEGDMILAAQPTATKVGFIGFDGQEGLYLKKKIVDKIWDKYHIPVAYYQALMQPVRKWMEFFTKTKDIVIPADSGCRGETAQKMKDVGLTCDPDGWWYSPSCRNDKDSCIPVLMGGVGWLGLETALVINYSSTPMAVSFLAWPDARILDDSVDALFFWWRPDWTYEMLGPVDRIFFPKHDRAAWAKAVYETDFPDFQLKKLMWHGVPGMSYKLGKLFDSFTVSWAEINVMMAEMEARKNEGVEDLKQSVACEWVKQNENIWRAWFPTVEPCKFGEGREADGSCKRCTPGEFSDTDEATNDFICHDCQTGRSSVVSGGTACELCTPGTHADEQGLSACKRCDVGKYAGAKGVIACDECKGDGNTTEYPSAASVKDCACDAGLYHALSGQCVTCKEGMTCMFGSSEANFGNNGTIPMLNKDYFSYVEKPLSVFLCLKDDACPGGEPGSCDGGRTGLVCSKCPDDKVLAGVECKDCVPVNKILLFLLVAAAVMAMTVIYQLSNDRMISDVSYALGFSVATGMLITLAQLLGSLNHLALPWPTEVQGFLDVGQFLIFNPNSIAAECIFGTAPATSYALRVAVPYSVVVFLFLLSASSKICCNCGPKRRPHVFTPWTFDKTCNTIGHVLQALFIAFAAIFATAFQCYSHPNDDQSIVVYPEVLCGTGDHTPLIIFAVILLSTFVIPFLGMCFWANLKAPAMSNDPNSGHLVRYRFLIYRFRPTVWWWGSVVIIRQLLLAFSPMVEPDDPIAQIMYVVSVLLIYIAISAYWWPWKSNELNVVETLSLVCLALFVIAAGSFVPKTVKGTTYSIFMVTLLVIIVTVLASVIVLAAVGFLVKGPGHPFGRQFMATPALRGQLSSQLLLLVTQLNSLSQENVAELLGCMSSFDRSAVADFISACHSLNTSAMAQQGGLVKSKSSRIANIPTVSTQREDRKEFWDNLAETMSSHSSKSGQNSAEEQREEPKKSPWDNGDRYKVEPATPRPEPPIDWTAANEGTRWPMDRVLHVHLQGTRMVTTPREFQSATRLGNSARGMTTPRTPPASPRDREEAGTPRSRPSPRSAR